MQALKQKESAPFLIFFYQRPIGDMQTLVHGPDGTGGFRFQWDEYGDLDFDVYSA